MPTISLPVTVDSLRAALTTLEVPSEVSATALYDALKTHNPPRPRRPRLTDDERKRLKESAERYYLRKNAIYEALHGPSSPAVLSNSDMGITFTVAKGSLRITLDVLAAAIKSLGLQDQISETALYSALEMELRRNVELVDVNDSVADVSRDGPPCPPLEHPRLTPVQLTERSQQTEGSRPQGVTVRLCTPP